MTPQEKAQELVDKMYGKTPVRDLIAQIEEDKQYAKQCALVAVDEILNINSVDKDFSLSFYWQDVKDEIQNL